VPVWQKDLRKLSNLIVDTDKDWLGYIIKNLGAIQIPRTDDPATLLEGLLWYRKDTDEWKYSPDGTNIKILGDWAVISDLTVDSDCDYVEWTGLDILTDGVYVIFGAWKNPTSSDTGILLFINGNETSTNYYTQILKGSGTNIYVARRDFPEVAVAHANQSNSFILFVLLAPDGYLRAIAPTNMNSPATPEVEVRCITSTFTVSNITSIRIQASVSGGIGAGSRFILCRVKGT